MNNYKKNSVVLMLLIDKVVMVTFFLMLVLKELTQNLTCRAPDKFLLKKLKVLK